MIGNGRMKKVLSILLCLCMLLQYVPMAGYATDGENPAEHHEETAAEPLTWVNQTVVPDADLPDNDELFAMYAEQKFYGYEMSTYGTRGRASLSGDELVIYDLLVPVIKDIAAGNRASAVVSVGQTVDNVDMGNGELVSLVPDISMTFTDPTFSINHVSRVMSALMLDYPYEMYWYDKTYGTGISYVAGSVIWYLEIYMSVAPEYAVDSYTANTAKTGATSVAAANAQAVVAANQGKSDYEKLVAYKDYICNAVDYNDDAADDNYTGPYGNPWQLIYVFDGDSSTKVVCEGYAKAFQYLCDLGGLDCISVSGYMSGGTGGGAHMWNVVTLEGQNYLVDVTNVDDGSIGSDGSLFMAGAAYDGSKYTFICYGSTPIYFVCDDLDLATENYVPGSGSGEHVHNYTASNPTCSCGMIGYCGGEGDGTNLTWVLEDGTLTISGTGKMLDFGDVLDSGTYNACPWENHKSSISTVVINEGVTTIGDCAFYYCENLIEVSIPNTVKWIGLVAFENCISLTDVTLPDSLERIYSWAFTDCKSLRSIHIPNSVKTIDVGAFAGCTGITSVTIPENVKELGFGAFCACSSLTEVTFCGNAPAIGEDVFGDIEATVYYPANDDTWTEEVMQQYGGTITWVPYGEETEISYTGYCGGEDDGTNLTWTVSEDGTTITISGTGEMAHFNDTGYGPWFEHFGDTLTTAIIEPGVTSIGGAAFWNCSALETVSIPDGVTQIGIYTFADTGLTEVDLPDSVESFGMGAFNGCTALTKVKLPEGLTYIAMVLFRGCSSLTEITLPESVTGIEFDAFLDCSSLKKVNIPASVAYMDGDIFGGTALEEVMVSCTWNNTLYVFDEDVLVYVHTGNTTLEGKVDATETTEGYTGDTVCECGAVLEYGAVIPATGAGFTLTGTITSYGDAAADVTVSLVDANGNIAYSLVLSGGETTYTFNNVAAGSYTLQITKANHAIYTYEVDVDGTNEDLNAKILQMGDVSGDGKVTATDYSRLLAHVKKTSAIADDYMLLCADVTGDGKITAADYSRLLAHVKKVTLLW